ncbi:MAG: ribonuclease D [Candidatus Competibacteraceae bacterium]|nr:ribonuclease D [Candidatus Competibacteraceae bacterium]
MSDTLYIDTPQALVEFCQSLRNSDWIALDTEFIRERTYYPQLCLIQIADANRIACIDPLALDNLEPLLTILYDPGITKVLHSASQDLEIFFHLRAAVPQPLFDTQVAATLMGGGDQIGYAALVKMLLNVDLDKSQTRTDWSQRPLEPAQLSYAADDVRYLRQIYQLQREELAQQNRLAWLADDFAALCDPKRYGVKPESVWQRIRGSNQLRGVQLAVLRALAAWREQRAMAADRPRRWILGDDPLLALARQMPSNQNQLQRVRGLEPAIIKRYGDSVLELIQQARQEPKNNWPTEPTQQRLSVAQEALVDAMMAVVRLCGAHEGVSPQALTSRKELEQWLANREDIALMHGWRAALAGNKVQALVRGELRLEGGDGGLRIVPS